MTAEEAISVIKTEIGQFIIDEKWKDAFDMAISALEKQIQKKPKVPSDTWVCPVCGRDVAIGWSGEK